jgi:ubiquinol-cytochrome c reductase cytochrome c subunit
VQRRITGHRGLRCCGPLLLPVAVLFFSAMLCPAQQNPVESPDRGAQIFAQRCSKCHGEHGEGISGVISIAGPSLKAEHNFGKVMTAVEVGPSHMPSFVYVLSVDDMRAVSHYVTDKIADIPLEEGDLGKGGDLFRMYCASCHRTAVRGGALAYDGTNAPSLAGKSSELIAGAVRWGPGPMPSFPPSVIDDKQLSSLVTYIRVVQNPSSPGGFALNWYGPTVEGCVAWGAVFGLVVFTIWIEKGGKG